MNNAEVQNPLLNHLIFSKILSFKSFNFEDLKSLRLVCSLWYTLCLDEWRRSVTVNLAENDATKNGVSIEALSQLHNIQLFHLQKKPYSKYKINGWSSSYPDSADTAWTKTIVPCLNSLQIKCCYFSDSNQIEGHVLSCGENLREMVLDRNSYGICRGYWSNEIKNEISILTGLRKLTVKGTMPMQWSKLLVHTPNLESLTFKRNGSYQSTTFAAFLLDLHQLEFWGRNPRHIKHLDIMEMDDSFTDFVSLSSRNLQLESLSIPFEKIRPEHFVRPLLQAQCRTLKILKLCRISNRVEVPFGFFEFPYSVHMPCLKELYLWGNIVNCFEFLRYMPNLKKLYVSRDRFEKRELIKQQYECRGTVEIIPKKLIVEPSENFLLTILEDLHVDCRFDPDDIQVLRKWMPNLKTISTILDSKNVIEICQQWPNICHVNGLYGSEVDFEGLQTLVQLKDLESLKLHAYCNKARINLADVRKAGLEVLGNLKHVLLCVSEDQDVLTTEVEKELNRKMRIRDNFAIIQIISNCGVNGSHHTNKDSCKRTKFFLNCNQVL